MTRNKQLQDLFHKFERHLGRPGTLVGAIEWGLENNMIDLPEIDPKTILIDNLKDALRSETRTDAAGNEYRANAAVTFTSGGGIQQSLWGDVDIASTPHNFMVEHFGQRRKGILDDCSRLKADVDHYNGTRSSKDMIQIVLDFTDDVAEREASRRQPQAAE